MTTKLPRKITAMGLIVLLNSVTSKPLKAQVPARSPTIPQVIPRDMQPPSTAPLPVPQPERSPSKEQLLPLPNLTPEPDEQLPSDIPTTIIVKRFEVVGSTVFSQEELAKATVEFTNRPISPSEVFQVRDQITELYTKNGYITSGAYIPPQKFQYGVITIQVVEGQLQSIEIKGTHRLEPNYVRSRIAAVNSGPLNRERLLKTLKVLQLNPLIQNLSAELLEGDKPGTSKLNVFIKEAKTFSTQVTLDNGRSPSIGSFQRRLQLNEANLLGLGDDLAIGYSNTDGSNFFNVSYTLPLNPQNGTLSFNYGTANSSVIERPFNVLDIKSTSRYYELTLHQPIVQSPKEEFAVGLIASRRESENTYAPSGERIPFPLLGSDNEGRTRISVLRFFQEWITRDKYQIFALRSQFNLGIGAFNATVNQDAPDSRFFYWFLQAQWVRLMARDTLVILRLNTQLASRTLPPLEQFTLGGIESVHGYRQDLLESDNGAFVSAEVQVPVLRVPKINGVLQVISFADIGFAWNILAKDNLNTDTPTTLASLGLGLRWSQGDRFTARLDWGIPLVSVDDSTQRTWQENGLYFSLQLNPF